MLPSLFSAQVIRSGIITAFTLQVYHISYPMDHGVSMSINHIFRCPLFIFFSSLKMGVRIAISLVLMAASE
jgi:hypothetical protein